MIGGFQEQEVSQDHREMLTAVSTQICAKGECTKNCEYKIVKVATQVVAGTMVCMHLADQTCENSPMTICVFLPLGSSNDQAQLQYAEKGHN